MRRFDKIKNMEKANLLAEQRYLESKGLLKESHHGVSADKGVLLGLDDNTKIKKNLPSDNVPEMTRLPEDKLHVTLTSIRSFKKIVKPKLAEMGKEFKIPTDIELPKVVLGVGSFAYRPEQKKVSYFLSVENQDDLKKFVDALYEYNGLKNPEPDRFFHVTVANNGGGNPLASIGNVTKQDLMEEETNDEIQVWFDLDGVLADMEGSLRKNNELQQLRADLDNTINNEFPDYVGLSNDEIKAKFKAELEANPDNEDVRRLKKVFKKYNNRVFKVAGVEGFYANLELIDGAVELVKFAHKVSGKKPNILSSPVGNENNPNNPSVKEKREWVQRHFGGLVDHVEITTDKARVINSEKDILIDDRTKYVDVFTNAGGSAILFKNAKQAANDLEQLISSLSKSGDNQEVR